MRSIRLSVSAGVLIAGAFASGASLAAPVTVVGTPTLDLGWGTPSNPNAWNPPAFNLVLDGTDFSYEGQQTFTWGPDADQIIISYVSGNVDPVITIGVGFVDNGAPSVFNFTVSSPLAPPITGYPNYELRLSGSFADGANNGGSAGVGTGIFSKLMDATLDGTPFDGVGDPDSFVAYSDLYGTFIKSGVVDCSATCSTFGINLSVLGSGGGDAQSFTGRFEIQVVPVPAAAWLFAPALGLMGFLRRRTG